MNEWSWLLRLGLYWDFHSQKDFLISAQSIFTPHPYHSHVRLNKIRKISAEKFNWKSQGKNTPRETSTDQEARV